MLRGNPAALPGPEFWPTPLEPGRHHELTTRVPARTIRRAPPIVRFHPVFTPAPLPPDPGDLAELVGKGATMSVLPRSAFTPTERFEYGRRVGPVRTRLETSPELTRTERLAMLRIGQYCDWGRNLNGCFLKNEKLAAELDLSVGHLGRLLRKLAAVGWIQIEHHPIRRHHHRYRSIHLGPVALVVPIDRPPILGAGTRQDVGAGTRRRWSEPGVAPKGAPEDEETTTKSADPGQSSSSCPDLDGRNPESLRPLPFPGSQSSGSQPAPERPQAESTAAPGIESAPIAAALVVEVLARFTAKMDAPPDRAMVENWIRDHGLGLVEVAAEMIERGKLRNRFGVASFLRNHHGRAPDFARADSGLPKRTPPPTQAPRPRDPEPPAELTVEERAAKLAELDATITEMRSRPRLREFEQRTLSLALKERAEIEGTVPDPGALP